MARRLTIRGTAFRPMLVWDGEYHEVGLRVLDKVNPHDTRWNAQGPVQNAAGFRGIRRLTNSAARRRRWHHFTIGSRWRARRFMEQVEPLVKAGLVAVVLDGERVRTRKR